jgi:hypothetical protein
MPDNQPTQPNLPPEMPDEESTRPQIQGDQTRAMKPQDVPAPKPAPPRRASAPATPPNVQRVPAPPPQPRIAQPYPEKPKRGAPLRPQRTRRDSPLYLPIWSVLLMLVIVGGSVSCIVLAVLSLGGRQAPAGSPRFVVITAAPTSTVGETPVLLNSPTAPAADQSVPGAAQAFALEGPTLPPIVLSPTPDTVSVGKTVVSTADESELNVRSGPGIQNDVVFRAPKGQTFKVIDGPQQADGFTWWKVQSTADGKEGWAVAVYLNVAQPQ